MKYVIKFTYQILILTLINILFIPLAIFHSIWEWDTKIYNFLIVEYKKRVNFFYRKNFNKWN